MDDGTSHARSLMDVFAAMSHGPADPAALAEAGHAGLPAQLVTEAIVNYADAAPVEVAQHLSPFVVANSAVPAPGGHPYPQADLPDAFSLLSTAPDPVPYDHSEHLTSHDLGHDLTHDVTSDSAEHPADGAHDGAGPASLLDDVQHHPSPGHAGHTDAGHADGGQGDLWFGHGQEQSQSAAGTPGHLALDPWLDGGQDHDAQTVPGSAGTPAATPDHDTGFDTGHDLDSGHSLDTTHALDTTHDADAGHDLPGNDLPGHG